MKELAEGIARRNNPPKILGEANQPQINVDGVGMPLSEDRERSNRRKRVIRSAFNYSMLFYMMLVVLNIVVGLMYHFGLIHSNPPSGNQ
jgi:hypothetical protein